ncbi:MAG: L-lactate dehydrogenase [Firmicutes bacterium]|nr:L-lactate dehydrogenase [Bacillota bacterium]
MKNKKVVIIGCGNVGMSYAYALLNQKTYVNELVLIDLNEERTIGEAMDLNHCLAFSPSNMKIKSGNYNDCKDASIVMIAAGANQKEGETRLDLLNKNSKIFKGIIDNVIESGFDGIFLVATNPVDVMTYITQKYSNFPHHRVIGSGTCLDSARLRYLIGEKLDIAANSVHGYVIGEHGDSEFIPWSNVNVGLQNINDFITDEDKNKIGEEVKNAAYEIINKKGATYYGIGMCLVKITNAILGDEHTVIVVSNYDKDNDVYVGLPAVLNKNGIDRKIHFNLTTEEEQKLQNSIDILKEAINSVDL